MPTNAINDTGVKYLYDKLHGEIEPVAEAVSTDTSTIEGNPINFSTKSAQTAQSTIIDLEPIQDLHGYDKPWVGGAGHNKYSVLIGNDGFSDLNSATHTSSSGTLVISASSKNYSGCYSGSNVTITTVIQPYSNTITYSFSIKTNKNATIQVGYENIDVNNYNCTTNWQRITRTITADGNKHLFLIYNLSGESVEIDIKDFMIEEGSTVHDYEPYENECPISGRSEIGILGCGKNLLDTSKAEIGTAWNGASNVNRARLVIPCKPNTTYTFSRNGNLSVSNMYANTSASVPASSAGTEYTSYTTKTFTSPSDAKYFILAFSKDNISQTDIDSMNLQLEEGSTATTYEPYTESNDLTISLGQTVYGGTLDVENGTLTLYDAKEKGFVRGSIDSSGKVYNINSKEGHNYRQLIKRQTLVTGSIFEKMAISDRFDYVLLNDARASLAKCLTQHDNNLYIGGYVGEESALDAFIDDLEICYKLATPITINLTPDEISLLEGINNISTTGDKITLTYRDGKVATLGDVKALGDNLTQEIADSQILTDTVTGDKYKLVVTSGVLSIEQISN